MLEICKSSCGGYFVDAVTRSEMKIESDFYYPFYYLSVENDFFFTTPNKTKISIEMDRLAQTFSVSRSS